MTGFHCKGTSISWLIYNFNYGSNQLWQVSFELSQLLLGPEAEGYTWK